MRCKSISTITTDGYRAGNEIGEALVEVSPEVVLLFASITYQRDFPDILDGLYDALENPETIVFGGTSDGIYETDRVAHHGICALGLNSEGKVQWTATVEPGVAVDSYTAARRCAERATRVLGGHIDYAFAVADGVKADGSQIVAGLSSILKIPFMGALAGDDRKFSASWIVVNGEVHEDSVAVLAARGSISYLINSASGWAPMGESGRVEQCCGSVVERISGMSPQAFIREQVGKTPGETDLGMVPLATYDPADDSHFFLRTPSRFDPATGAVTLFGSLEKDASVRVCTATLEDVLNGVEKAMNAAQQAAFQPSAALIVSCAVRNWLLEDRLHEEVDRVLAAVGQRIPLIGLPSFGEIGPFLKEDGTYTATFFHNVTFVICLFGA
jgi:hypothetical protein